MVILNISNHPEICMKNGVLVSFNFNLLIIQIKYFYRLLFLKIKILHHKIDY